MRIDADPPSCGGKVLGVKGRIERSHRHAIDAGIRAGGSPLPPGFREWLLELEVYQGRSCLRQCLLADVRGIDFFELIDAQPWTRHRHVTEPDVTALGNETG